TLACISAAVVPAPSHRTFPAPPTGNWVAGLIEGGTASGEPPNSLALSTMRFCRQLNATRSEIGIVSCHGSGQGQGHWPGRNRGAGHGRAATIIRLNAACPPCSRPNLSASPVSRYSARPFANPYNPRVAPFLTTSSAAVSALSQQSAPP